MDDAVPDQPTGTVTFLFCDVEGSTRRLERDVVGTGAALARYHELVDAAVRANGGIVFERVGDGAYAAFDRPSGAALAAVAVQRALAVEPWPDGKPLRARIAIDTGEVETRDSRHYFGRPLFRVARLQAVGSGGQTLVSGTTARLLSASIPDTLALIDLGTHVLKDVDEPERIYELSSGQAGASPPLRTAEPIGHLPSAPRPLVGREADLGELIRLLEDHRLVTITGPGGIGKTSVAVELASRLADRFADGVAFVDFAAVRDAERVPELVASELRIRERPPTPLAETLIAELRDRRTLLLLDTFETVVGAAELVGRLAGAPGVRIVLTSREALRLREEREFALGPLPLPGQSDVEVELADVPSVRLFVDRARAVAPSFGLDERTAPVVVAICERLDGLPLAIELAAALSRLLSPAEMLARLDAHLDLLTARARDLPERQRTLRATVAWSYELLDVRQRTAFEGLSVFRDGFSLEAAGAVLEERGAEVMTLVGDLLDKSLLARRDGSAATRFRMLDTIRDYALERLHASPEHERRELGLTRWVHQLLTDDRGKPLRVVDASALPNRVAAFDLEHENVIHALTWLEAAGRDVEFIDLVAAASSYWLAGRHRRAGLPWVRRATELARETEPSASAALILRNAASHEASSGHGGEAFELIDRSMAAWMGLGDKRGLADAIRLRASILAEHGQIEAGRVALIEAEALARAVGDEDIVRMCLADLGALAMDRDDRGEAHRLYEELRIASERAGDRFGVALARGNSAFVYFLDGDLDRAEADARAALSDLGPEGTPAFVAWAQLNLAVILLARGDSQEARAHGVEALGLAWDTGSAPEIAEGLEVLADVQLAEGDPRRAIELIAASERIRAEAELPLRGEAVTRAARRSEQARGALGAGADVAFAAARTREVAAVVSEATNGTDQRTVTGSGGDRPSLPRTGPERQAHS